MLRDVGHVMFCLRCRAATLSDETNCRVCRRRLVRVRDLKKPKDHSKRYKEKTGERRCTLCGSQGHNKRTCPQRELKAAS